MILPGLSQERATMRLVRLSRVRRDCHEPLIAWVETVYIMYNKSCHLPVPSPFVDTRVSSRKATGHRSYLGDETLETMPPNFHVEVFHSPRLNMVQ